MAAVRIRDVEAIDPLDWRLGWVLVFELQNGSHSERGSNIDRFHRYSRTPL